jgi:predicted AAA+ superfamily ATPase
VIENVASVAPEGTALGFYRTSAGAGIDLVLQLPGHSTPWAIEIKRGLASPVRRGFHLACGDLRPERSLVVYSGDDRFPIAEGVEAIGLRELAQELADG